jgi:serine/threonine-protein kinase
MGAPFVGVGEAESGVLSSRGLPRRFGRYLLFDRVGKGGMAEVFLARAETDLDATGLCAVKQIGRAFAALPEFESRFIHEAILASRLSHANICQVFDLGREEDDLFIAMEYVEGCDLAELVQEQQEDEPLAPELGVMIVADVLAGLDHAHRSSDGVGNPLGIVHCDVAPSNILLSLHGEVKLCDFGIAKAGRGASSGAGWGSPLQGKLAYMSPEHARGEEVDARADVFSAGVVLWEMLAGRRMVRRPSDRPGATARDLVKRGDVPNLAPRGWDGERYLMPVAMRALARDKDARYPTAAEMLADLEDAMQRAGITASRRQLGELVAARFGPTSLALRRAQERAVATEYAGESQTRLIAAARASRPPSAPPTAPPPAPSSSSASSVPDVESGPQAWSASVGATPTPLSAYAPYQAVLRRRAGPPRRAIALAMAVGASAAVLVHVAVRLLLR